MTGQPHTVADDATTVVDIRSDLDTVQPTRIVLADGTDQRRALAVHHLTRAGYVVEAVSDAGSAWGVLRREAAQLAILEVKPPDLTGLEVLRRLRGAQWQSDDPIPVILIVSGLRDQDVDAGIALGATEFLVKPFSQRELVLRVDAVLRNRPVLHRAWDEYLPRHSSAPALSIR